MALIKIKDIAYGRLRAPDLGLMEDFLVNFGMIKAERTKSALYMRGTDSAHHIHVVEMGPPRFLGFAYYATDEGDLDAATHAPGASTVEHIDEPGGGKRVRLREPNGYQIDIVHGIAAAPAIPVVRQKINTGQKPLNRAGELMRLPQGPAKVKRVAHGVLSSPKVRETTQWFRDTLGLVCSDELYAGEPDNIVQSFLRCDRGNEYVDHHVFLCCRNERAGLNHIAFEVQDIDDVFLGHEHL
jgi:hypothetical protein